MGTEKIRIRPIRVSSKIWISEDGISSSGSNRDNQFMWRIGMRNRLPDESTTEGILRIFGSQTFVPMSWMCMKQTAVPHKSTVSEVITSDAGLRHERCPRSRS